MSPSLQRAHHYPPRAVPFNITIVQAYAPASDYDDNEKEKFNDQLQNVIDQTPKKDILVGEEPGMQKWAGMLVETGKAFVDPSAMVTQMRGDSRLLEFATFNDLVLANTLGHHEASRRWTWHSPNGQHQNQVDYILVRKRSRSGVNIARTRSFPGADTGSCLLYTSPSPRDSTQSRMPSSA